VRHVHVDDCAWSGFDIYGDGNAIESSRATHNIAGIFVRPGANDNRVIGNEIQDNNRMSVLTQTPTDDDSGAFGILLQGDGTRVSSNRIGGSNAFSYDYGNDGAAIEVYGGRNNRIVRNEAIANETFTELGDPGTEGNTYSYNVIRSSLPAAKFLVTRGSDSRWGPVLRTAVYNNTVHLDGAGSEGVVCHGGCGNSVLAMQNNIVEAAKIGYADARFDEDHNLYSAPQPPSFEIGANTILADPQFRDPAAGNLRLRSSSPALDRGVDLGFRLDFDDVTTPQDGNGDGIAVPDLGAFEFSPGG
jgi:hypothetical protein